MILDHPNYRVTIVLDRSTKHLRPETIHCYLPGLSYIIDHYPPIPVVLKDFLPANRIYRKSLCYLFDYLEEIDQGLRTSTALSERLNNPWDVLRHGPNEKRNLFMALGRILHKDWLGCNRNLQSIMKAYVLRHCADIVREQPGGWIGYVNTLEGMGTDPAELAEVLSHIMQEHQKSHVPFFDPTGRLSYNACEILDDLISDKQKRHARARQSCEHCKQRRTHGRGDRRMIQSPNLYIDDGFHGRGLLGCGRV